MSNLFGREAEVTIKPSFGLPLKLKFPPLSCNLIVHEGRRQTATIRIFNATKEIEDKASLRKEGSGWKGAKVSVKAGHSKSVKEFFEGRIFYSESYSSKGDRVLDIHCSDELAFTGNKLIQKSFSKMPLQAILESILPSTGLSRGNVIINSPGIHTLSFGTVFDALDYFSKLENHSFSIVNNSLNLFPNSSKKPSFQLFNESNVLGEPEKIGNGYRFTTIFNPSLHPLEFVTVKFDSISGLVRLRKINHFFTTSIDSAYSEAEFDE